MTNPAYGGLLGAITEAVNIQAELDCSSEQAHAVQQERAAARLREHREFQVALTESTVIPFRRKHWAGSTLWSAGRDAVGKLPTAAAPARQAATPRAAPVIKAAPVQTAAPFGGSPGAITVG